MKKFKFYYDQESGKRHFENHGVTIQEIDEFFNDTKYLCQKLKDNSYVAYSKLESWRCLKTIYRLLEKDILLIITAYDIEDKEIINLLNAL